MAGALTWLDRPEDFLDRLYTTLLVTGGRSHGESFFFDLGHVQRQSSGSSHLERVTTEVTVLRYSRVGYNGDFTNFAGPPSFMPQLY